MAHDPLAGQILHDTHDVMRVIAKGTQSNSNLSGVVAIQFAAVPTGQVVRAVVQTTSVKNKAIEGCLTKAAKRWRFPKPREGAIAIASAYFMLNQRPVPGSGTMRCLPRG